MAENEVAIVGAGPAGLATGRALKALGIPFQIFEKHSDVGGIWDRSNPGSPMYKSAHFISSKTMSGHNSYPMPDDYPDYPSNEQILNYIRGFARTFDLYPQIRFETPIRKARLKNEHWEIETDSGTEAFGWLVCANGTNWHPNRPKLEGEESFDGEIIHSVDYKDCDRLRGKKVLVVGGGNSGVDIACDAARAADEATISLRRGYHFVPKHLFGMPADVFGAKTAGGPMWLEQRTFSLILRILNGDLTRLGLQKPDHRVLSSHPIMNTQILHYLQHGDLKAKPDINRLSGREVHFTDGTTSEVDLILLATGYNWKIPYLDAEHFDWEHGRPDLYLKIYSPKCPRLFVNGFVETNSAAYGLFDDMSDLIARAIEARIAGTDRSAELDAIVSGQSPDLSGRIPFVDSGRHSGYANKDTYVAEMKKFRRQLGWPEQKPDQYAELRKQSTAPTE